MSATSLGLLCTKSGNLNCLSTVVGLLIFALAGCIVPAVFVYGVVQLFTVFRFSAFNVASAGFSRSSFVFVFRSFGAPHDVGGSVCALLGLLFLL